MEAETQTLTDAEALQSRIAIRSIKVALLLSRLKPSSIDRRLTDHRDAATEKEEALRREIGDLKMEVVRERLRNKRIRLCGLMELFLEFVVLFVLCGLLFAIAVGGDGGFNIEGNWLLGSSLYEKGLAYCWFGARANVGIIGGKYCFGCKVVSFQSVQMEDTAPEYRNLCRVGISRGDDVVGSLGETSHSFGYEGTGKFWNATRSPCYGEKFGLGDTIVCAVNLEEKPLASISFSKNLKCLGTAMKFNAAVDPEVKNFQWESDTL